jgi:hypothetical protein
MTWSMDPIRCWVVSRSRRVMVPLATADKQTDKG